MAFGFFLVKLFAHTSKVKLTIFLFVIGNLAVRILPSIATGGFTGSVLVASLVLSVFWTMFAISFLLILSKNEDSIGGWLATVIVGGVIYLLLL
jgi:hypothetical protein